MRSLFFISTVVLTCALSLIVSISLLLATGQDKTTQTLLSPIVEGAKQSQVVIHSLFASRLEKVVEKNLQGVSGTYSVYVKNLKTGETYSLNPDNIYSSASLYKLWVMAVVYEDIEKGTLKRNDQLTQTVASLNTTFGLASSEAQMQNGTISYTVDEALQKMITVSDNYAAYLLTEKVGTASVSHFLKEHDFSHSDFSSPPHTSASDIAAFYQMLYQKTLVSAASSEHMLALLKQQQINDRLPKYLPRSITVAHKTGELDGFKHDAGIVYTPQGDYILVMLSNTEDPKKASEQMALLSKAIYDYFKKEE